MSDLLGLKHKMEQASRLAASDERSANAIVWRMPWGYGSGYVAAAPKKLSATAVP